LTDEEQPVLLLHPHWKTLIRPILIAVLVVAVVLVAEVIPSGALTRAAIGVVAVLVLIVTRHGRDIPLTRINDVSFEKGLLDRLLGAGRLVVESAGEHGQIVLTDIPHVEYVQATLFRLVEDEQRRLERDQRNQP